MGITVAGTPPNPFESGDPAKPVLNSLQRHHDSENANRLHRDSGRSFVDRSTLLAATSSTAITVTGGRPGPPRWPRLEASSRSGYQSKQ